MSYSVYNTNKRCLGCGETLFWDPVETNLKCKNAMSENLKCRIITLEEVSYDWQYGSDQFQILERTDL